MPQMSCVALTLVVPPLPLLSSHATVPVRNEAFTPTVQVSTMPFARLAWAMGAASAENAAAIAQSAPFTGLRVVAFMMHRKRSTNPILT
jgi:K+-transporting ATPase A subunit